MAKKRVYGFDEAGFLRVREATRRVLGSPRTGSQRRRQVPIVGGGCKGRNEVWKFKVTGTPTSGSFNVDVTVGGTQETLTFNYNWTAAQVKTELATHTNLASTDLDTAGGPFPGAEITVEFIGDFAKKQMFDSASNAPVIDDSGLTGGTSPAAFLLPYQPGYPGNANP